MARGLVGLLAVSGVFVAWRVGGGADAAPPPPVAVTPLTSTGASLDLVPGYEVATRLVEVASAARFEVPSAEARRRRPRPPFLSTRGDASRFVANVALRAGASAHGATPLGKAGRPLDARTRSMNEDSVDQREALIAPAPASITFRVDVPRGAQLTFAEGTIDATDESIVFVVSVLDANNAWRELYRHALVPRAARGWTDATCDLSAFAGQNVGLRLATERGTALPAADAGLTKEAAPVGLWGNPTILARTTPRVPYNVLWIVVGGLRPDVIATFHDDAEDAAQRAAPWPPLEALLPKVAELTPEIDDLTRRGVRFTHAHSAGTWTRPATLAALAGARASELGIDRAAGTTGPREVERFYESNPPLLSLLLRRQHVVTRAFVNDELMASDSPSGIDMGFERVGVHRHRTRDTLAVTEDASRWIKENKDTRFFAFVSYESLHEPYDPPAKHLDRVPGPPVGPKDEIARLYMAEAAKADEAIGVLTRTLDETGLRDRTIVIISADHGETMSSAHADRRRGGRSRDHGAASNFEETTKIPIVIALPGTLPAGQEVKPRVRSIDIAPTILELLGVEAHPKMTGTSLVPLANGRREAEERVVVSEGKGSRAIMYGKWRLIARDGAATTGVPSGETGAADFELYDLVVDPGERHNLFRTEGDVASEMRARLDAALENVPVAGWDRRGRSSPSAPGSLAEEPLLPTIHLRFAGGGRSRRVSGTITIGDARIKPKTYEVDPVGLGRDAFHREAGRVDVAFHTNPDLPVGFDVVVEPSGTPVTWELWLDDHPWPEDGVFGGPFGLLAPALRNGLVTEEARFAARASALPTIDPRRDQGLFVVRERRSGDEPREDDGDDVARFLQVWGSRAAR